MLLLFGLAMTIALIQLTCVFVVITTFSGYVTNTEILILAIESWDQKSEKSLSSKKVLSLLRKNKSIPSVDTYQQESLKSSKEFTQSLVEKRRLQMAFLITSLIWILIGFLPFLYRDYR